MMDVANLRERLVASLPDPPGPDWAAIERAVVAEGGAVSLVEHVSAPTARRPQAAGDAETTGLAGGDGDDRDGGVLALDRPGRRPRLRLLAQGLALVVALAIAVIAAVATRSSERGSTRAVAGGLRAPGNLPGRLWFAETYDLESKSPPCRLKAYSFATGSTTTASSAAGVNTCTIWAASPNGRYFAFGHGPDAPDWLLDVQSGRVLPGTSGAAGSWSLLSKIPVVTDDGQVASCTGHLQIRQFGRPARDVAGCDAAVAGGRLVVLDPTTGAIRDFASGKTIVVADAARAHARALAGTRDGLIAVVGDGNRVDVYGLDGRLRFTSSVVLPPTVGGAWLADGGATLAVWPRQDGVPWQMIRLADGARIDNVDGFGIEEVSFAPGGRTAAVSTWSGTGGSVALIDTATLRRIGSLHLSPHDAQTLTVQWTP
jgi:hypothetical protein